MLGVRSCCRISRVAGIEDRFSGVRDGGLRRSCDGASVFFERF